MKNQNSNASVDMLLLAKTFCLKADEELNRRTALGRMLSVMNMQDAVEFSMSAISFKYQITHNGNDNHGVRWKNIDDSLTGDKNKLDKLILKQQVDAINIARNRVKHHGSVPSLEDALLHLRIGRTFLEDVFSRLFGYDFDTLSQVDLIDDDAVKVLLKTAEGQITQTDYLEALISIKDAFIQATPSIHYLVGQVGYYGKNKKFINLDPSNSNSTLQEAVIYLLLGLDLVKVKRFEQITPRYDYHSIDDLLTGYSIVWPDLIKPSRQIAQEALGFVVDTVLKWQEGDLLHQQEYYLELELDDVKWRVVRTVDYE